ncbi:uncharacterized protein TNCV_1991571 [Trichonephila clavipes]|nr:uncharacterized protein TNCV_1991571 [Trichonephila clavipes]
MMYSQADGRKEALLQKSADFSSTSTRAIASKMDIMQTVIWNVLHKIEMYSFHIQKVSDRGLPGHEFDPSTTKDRRVGQRCTLNLSRAETSSRWCGVVVRERVPAQVSSTSLDHGSKLRGPSPKALV